MRMKKNEIQELVGLGEKAISAKITELQKDLDKFVLEFKRGQVKNVREGKNLRQTIAKLKTLQKARKGAK